MFPLTSLERQLCNRLRIHSCWLRRYGMCILVNSAIQPGVIVRMTPGDDDDDAEQLLYLPEVPSTVSEYALSIGRSETVVMHYNPRITEVVFGTVNDPRYILSWYTRGPAVGGAAFRSYRGASICAMKVNCIVSLTDAMSYDVEIEHERVTDTTQCNWEMDDTCTL